MRFVWLLLLTALNSGLPLAHASGTGSELEQQIYSSAGIASPGFNTGLNPAGYAYNVTTKFAAIGTYSTGAALPGVTPYSLRPEIIFASRVITGGINYTYPSNSITLNLAGLPSRMIALGLGVTGTAPTFGSFVFTPGILINPMGKFRIGALANTTLNNISLLGAGIALDPSKVFRITVDATSITPYNNVTLTPGLTIGGMSWRLTGAYAYTLGGVTAGTGAIQLGAGLALGNSFFLQVRTSGFSSWMAGLAFKLAK